MQPTSPTQANAVSTPSTSALAGVLGQSAPDPAAIAALAVRGVAHIATLPDITISIIEIVENPSSSAQDLNKVIANDPALSARILKVVNSAFYGLPRQIGSINRAISLLGLNAVKNLAIAASLAKLFKGGSLGSRFDAKDLWTHSVAVAAVSKVIATNLKLSFADEALLAGLLHDIGLMVELQSEREKFGTIVQKMDLDKEGKPLCDFLEVERSVLGCDHGIYGAALCEAWKFPKSFTNVCGHHHDPLKLPADLRTLTWIVHVADRLAVSAQKKGFRLDVMSCDITEEAIASIGMTPDGLAHIRASLPAMLDGVEAQFGTG
ncbi:MAG: HDOD domain-containing protein [Phycisphaerae bacterium]|nr:HDOD domain-containing protein [Phycisphaerae bacterium]